VKWLRRDAFILPIYFGLATDAKKLKKELNRMKVPDSVKIGVNAGYGATTSFLTNGEGDTCAIVCIFDYSKKDYNQIAALLVHEAVHIWQETKKIMGEESPSKEFEAYTIQSISQKLFYEFAAQTKTGIKK